MPTQEKTLANPNDRGCSHTWVSVDDLADELQIPKSTIYGWKTRGLGPRWTRVGKHLRARRTDVDAWLDSLSATETSAAPEYQPGASAGNDGEAGYQPASLVEQSAPICK